MNPILVFILTTDKAIPMEPETKTITKVNINRDQKKEEAVFLSKDDVFPRPHFFFCRRFSLNRQSWEPDGRSGRVCVEGKEQVWVCWGIKRL